MVGKAEVHIRPHHRVEAVFLCDFKHSPEVFIENVEAVLVAVLVQIFAQSQHVCFVHADVHKVGGEALAQGTEHVFDQLVGARVLCQKNVGGVTNALVGIPTEDLIQVRQRLHAGNDLNTDGVAVGNDVLQFLLGIFAAHVTEVGLVIHLVRVLCVKLEHIIAEIVEQGDEFFDLFGLHDCVS